MCTHTLKVTGSVGDICLQKTQKYDNYSTFHNPLVHQRYLSSMKMFAIRFYDDSRLVY